MNPNRKLGLDQIMFMIAGIRHMVAFVTIELQVYKGLLTDRPCQMWLKFRPEQATMFTQPYTTFSSDTDPQIRRLDALVPRKGPRRMPAVAARAVKKISWRRRELASFPYDIRPAFGRIVELTIPQTFGAKRVFPESSAKDILMLLFQVAIL
jgi:hypothetical protein